MLELLPKVWTKGELCYNVHHVEKNGRNRGNPWSLRQTGIYHQINLVTKRSSWIFIQLSSTARNKVIGALKDEAFRENPMLLHLDVLFAMAMNWPSYIEYLSYKLDELVSHQSTLINQNVNLKCWIGRQGLFLKSWGENRTWLRCHLFRLPKATSSSH
jgi:hypothetical protein